MFRWNVAPAHDLLLPGEHCEVAIISVDIIEHLAGTGCDVAVRGRLLPRILRQFDLEQRQLATTPTSSPGRIQLRLFLFRRVSTRATHRALATR